MRNPSSKFSIVPLASKGDIGRSISDRNHDFKFTLSAGKLYPIYVDEYIPGDTFKLDTSFVCRMSTPIHPVMDNCFMDIYYFSVPYRLCWDHWKEFMGESPEDPYINPVTYTIPQLKPDPDLEYPTVPAKSLMDYMGIPAGTTPRSFSALPFRAFSIIWNEYFRDQNLQNAIDVDTSDSDGYYMNDTNIERDNYVLSTALGGALPPVNKYHDYFTSALLEPQKGEAVPIPLPAMSPVYASDEANLFNYNGIAGSQLQLAQPYSAGTYNLFGERGTIYANDEGFVYTGEEDPEFGTSGAQVTPVNLVAGTRQGDEFSKKFGYLGASINDLRYAFQIQKLLEADNRYGTRYTEIIKGHFGVNAPNGLLQRPEFLGGKRVRININQVLQTSATNEVSPQGNTAAYSVTSDRDASFTKSFTEHGVIIGVACIRNENTYQQGIEKFWLRKDRYDFYFPELANISEQPIQIQELYNPQTGPGYDQEFNPFRTFGYQEAWADYRYKPNRVSGEFRSTYSQSLDVWHYADYYESEPVLSDEWIRADRANIDRTLAVSSDVSDQFIADFYFKVQATRPMPMYSIPGLSDHH